MSAIWGDAGEAPAVLAEVRDGVGVITLNRPERMNAFNPAMGTLYFNALEQFARDPAVRAILVTGQGSAFCAGADVGGLGKIADGADYQAERDGRPYWHPLSIGKPIVAAIRGACFGLGLQVALFCDLRFVGDDARIATAYARRGLVGEIGVTWILPRIVGAGAAMDLMVSGRTIGAEEALRIGLANRIAPADSVLDEAFAYCRTLAETCSPWSMRIIKQQLYADLMADLPTAFGRSEVLLQEALAGPDFAEGVRAFIDKRPAAFPPLASALAMIDRSSEA